MAGLFATGSGAIDAYAPATSPLPPAIAQVTGQYVKPQLGAMSDGVLAGGNSLLSLAPGYIPNSLIIDAIGAVVTTVGEAGSKLRLGIYADNGSFYPGALVLDAGQIDGASATAQEIDVANFTLTPGWYWFGAAPQSAPTTRPTVRALSMGTPGLKATSLANATGSGGTRAYTEAGVTGALPATFTTLLTGSGNVPMIVLKLA